MILIPLSSCWHHIPSLHPLWAAFGSFLLIPQAEMCRHPTGEPDTPCPPSPAFVLSVYRSHGYLQASQKAKHALGSPPPSLPKGPLLAWPASRLS